MGFLGIDTSNYTTSAAVLDDAGEIMQEKLPLPVEPGAVGLRQSDAVFFHVKQMGPLMKRLMERYCGGIDAVGVSVSPRDETGSYMPCFLAGHMCASSAAAALRVPLYEYSHQAGHIAAVIYDIKAPELFDSEFLAFHISGGTTQCLLVRPGVGAPFEITTVAKSLDLHAGQLIDRVGVMLGLDFPAGAALTELAAQSQRDYRIRVAFKGLDCCLSGVENKCRDMLEKGESPQDTARYCIAAVENAVMEMTERTSALYPGRPLVYAGGVMSSHIIRTRIERSFDARFASPAFSADNAAGTAVLCGISHLKRETA